ncbi:hypothetical protein ACET3Z_011328 [Daucus carota]
MMKSESPNIKSCGSCSSDSVKNWEGRLCFCGKQARVYTSWTLKNPGRRFYTCSTPKEIQGCHFFEWIDEGFSGRAFDVITHLNHRRIFLEEKLKHVEEDLEENIEKRRTLKDEKLQLIDGNKAFEADLKLIRRQLKLCVLVCVLLFAVVLMSF